MKFWLGTLLAAFAFAGSAQAAPLPSCAVGSFPSSGYTPDYRCSASATVAGRTVAADCRQESWVPGPGDHTETRGCAVTAAGRTVSADRCVNNGTAGPGAHSSETCHTGAGAATYTCRTDTASGDIHYFHSSTQTCGTAAAGASQSCRYDTSFGGSAAGTQTSDAASCAVAVSRNGVTAETRCEEERTSTSSGGGPATTEHSDGCTTTVSRGGKSVTCTNDPLVQPTAPYRDPTTDPARALDTDPDAPACG